MASKIIYFIILGLFYLQLQAQTPLLKPQSSNSEQDSLINIGTSLHDQGKYDEAISTYQDVLKGIHPIPSPFTNCHIHSLQKKITMVLFNIRRKGQNINRNIFLFFT